MSLPLISLHIVRASSRFIETEIERMGNSIKSAIDVRDCKVCASKAIRSEMLPMMSESCVEHKNVSKTNYQCQEQRQTWSADDWWGEGSGTTKRKTRKTDWVTFVGGDSIMMRSHATQKDISRWGIRRLFLHAQQKIQICGMFVAVISPRWSVHTLSRSVLLGGRSIMRICETCICTGKWQGWQTSYRSALFISRQEKVFQWNFLIRSWNFDSQKCLWCVWLAKINGKKWKSKPWSSWKPLIADDPTHLCQFRDNPTSSLVRNQSSKAYSSDVQQVSEWEEKKKIKNL